MFIMSNIRTNAQLEHSIHSLSASLFLSLSLYMTFLILLCLLFHFHCIELYLYETTGWQSCKQQQRLNRFLLHSSFLFISAQPTTSWVFHDLVMIIAHERLLFSCTAQFMKMTFQASTKARALDGKFRVLCCVRNCSGIHSCTFTFISVGF